VEPTFASRAIFVLAAVERCAEECGLSHTFTKPTALPSVPERQRSCRLGECGREPYVMVDAAAVALAESKGCSCGNSVYKKLLIGPGAITALARCRLAVSLRHSCDRRAAGTSGRASGRMAVLRSRSRWNAALAADSDQSRDRLATPAG